MEVIPNLTPAQLHRRRKLSLELIWACAIFLLPWSVYLFVTLPHKYSTQHYDLAWGGFDVLELLALGATAYFGWRRRQAMIAAAMAAATLLVCDAWFDVSLSLGTPDIWAALASALFIELPLAAFLVQRVRLILRIMLTHLYPYTDERGRPMRLTRMPLLALLFAAEVAEQEAQSAGGGGDPARAEAGGSEVPGNQ